MKADLNLRLIKSLTLEQISVGVDDGGKLKFDENLPLLVNGQPNPAHKPAYILWDSNRQSPPGFGIKVANKKTYVLRRKVNGTSLMPTVGNVSDFLTIEDARAKAAVLARQLVDTGRNPNELARRAAEAELTLGLALARYREHRVTRCWPDESTGPCKSWLGRALIPNLQQGPLHEALDIMYDDRHAKVKSQRQGSSQRGNARAHRGRGGPRHSSQWI